MKSFCGKCKIDTNQQVLFERTDHIHEESGWQEYNYYQVIRCEGCDTFSFRKLHNDIAMNSDWDPSLGGAEPLDIELYPNRSIHHLEIRRFNNTPNNINIIYQETINAYNNNQLILCSGGLRAIIEGICNDRGITGANLKRKIEGLAANGLLTTRDSDVLHNLRFIGNDALHGLTVPSKAELKLAFNIVEHTIESLYEIEHKANNLKTKITERKNIQNP